MHGILPPCFLNSALAMSRLCAELEPSVAADHRAGGIRSIRGTEHGNDTGGLVFVCLFYGVSNHDWDGVEV
jgi:hypothetical protein